RQSGQNTESLQAAFLVIYWTKPPIEGGEKGPGGDVRFANDPRDRAWVPRGSSSLECLAPPWRSPAFKPISAMGIAVNPPLGAASFGVSPRGFVSIIVR